MRSSRLLKFILFSLIIHIGLYYLLPGSLFRVDSRTLSLGDDEYIQEVAFVKLEEEEKEKAEEPKGQGGQPAAVEPDSAAESGKLHEEKPGDLNNQVEGDKAPPVHKDDSGENNSTQLHEPVKDRKEAEGKGPEEVVKEVESVQVAEETPEPDGTTAEVDQEEAPDIITSERGKEELNVGEGQELAEKKGTLDEEKGTGTNGAGQKVEQKEFIPPEPASLVASSTYITYPKDAVSQGLEGEVEVLVDVNVAGEIESVRLIKDSGIKELDQVALIIERYWQFKPSLYPYHLLIKVIYDLDQGQPKVIFEKVDFDRGGSN